VHEVQPRGLRSLPVQQDPLALAVRLHVLLARIRRHCGRHLFVQALRGLLRDPLRVQGKLQVWRGRGLGSVVLCHEQQASWRAACRAGHAVALWRHLPKMVWAVAAAAC